MTHTTIRTAPERIHPARRPAPCGFFAAHHGSALVAESGCRCASAAAQMSGTSLAASVVLWKGPTSSGYGKTLLKINVRSSSAEMNRRWARSWKGASGDLFIVIGSKKVSPATGANSTATNSQRKFQNLMFVTHPKSPVQAACCEHRR